MAEQPLVGRRGSAPAVGPSAGGTLSTGMEPPTVRDWLVTVRRHLPLVVGVTLAVIAVTVYVAYVLPPVYRATSVVRLVDARRAIAGGLVDATASGDIALPSANPILSQVEVLRSRGTIGAVVDDMPVLRIRTRQLSAALVHDLRLAGTVGSDSLHLTFGPLTVTVEGQTPPLEAAYGAPVEVRGIAFTIAGLPSRKSGTLYVVPRDAAIGGLGKRLSVKQRIDTDVIDIAFTASDPARAQEVANRIAQMFQAGNARAARQEARRRREFIETQLRFNDSLLAEARVALTAYRAQEPGLVADRAGALWSGLEGRREELEVERRQYSGLLSQLRDSNRVARRTALRNVIASSTTIGANLVVSRLYDQLAGYEAQRDSLTSGEWARTATNPDVQRVALRIGATEGDLIGAVQSVVASLDARIAVLGDLRARSIATARRLSSTQASEDVLMQQVDNARSIADHLRVEYQKARIAEAVEPGRIEIVDLAPLPEAPIGAGRPQVLLFGMLLGVLLGGGSAALADHLNRSVHRREHVEELGLPVLGIIPHARQNGGSSAQETAPVVEAMRGIRFNVLHAMGGAKPAVFTLTSPGSREGKSFVSANLALAFADAGHRTLLIDGDLRRGSLYRLLGTRRLPGLTDVLHGEVGHQEVIQATPYAPLFFVAAGTRTPDAPELLVSEGMTTFLANIRQSFEVIIVDSPPLGAGVDAYALGAVTGNLLLLLRVGSTDREIAVAKLDLLDRLPVRLLGTVLNDVPAHSSYYPYSYSLQGYAWEAERGRQPRSLVPQPSKRNHRVRR